MSCSIIPDSGTFASTLIAYADCQTQAIGQQGYLTLAAGGSSISQCLTILITILIAIVGYRLILGDTPSLKEGVITVVKIGAVVAFSTGWPAYQTVIYNVAIRAPAEIGSTVGGAVGLPGSIGDLALHLDAVDQQLQTLSIYQVNRPLVEPPPGTVPPPLFAGFDVFALGAARLIFLASAVGAYVSTRLIAGVLLALGPLFIAFLLFDTTRGLLEGWIKVLAGSILGTLATSIILGTELAFLEPWLIDLISVRGSAIAIPAAASQLLATTTLFAIALFAAIAAVGKIAWSLRLSSYKSVVFAPPTSEESRTSVMRRGHEGGVGTAAAPRSRARLVADALTSLDRREAAAMSNNVTTGFNAARVSATGGSALAGTTDAAGNRSGAPTRRHNIGSRTSASAQRRDRMP